MLHQVDSRECIGIVGINGDLGSRMAMQLCATKPDAVILGYDVAEAASSTLYAIDPTVSWLDAAKRPQIVDDPDTLIGTCGVVHYCTPARVALGSLHKTAGLRILHESNMSNSKKVADQLTGAGVWVGVGHCLMNSAGTVVVATDVGDPETTLKHMQSIGLSTHEMTVAEHENLAAHTQAVLALLKEALLAEMREHHTDGLLTSSAEELLRALAHRESQWTDATVDSIMANPALTSLIATLIKTVLTHQPGNDTLEAALQTLEQH